MKKHAADYDIPILLIVFTRLDTLKKVFAQVQKVRPKKLYIAADGPRKGKDDESKIEAVRNYLLGNIDWDCEVQTRFKEENLGCKYNPQSAITWFFDQEEQGIILEDDVVPSDSFFGYCKEMLSTYKDDLRVWGITGTNMLGQVNIGHSYYFSDFFMTWGWATWASRWHRHLDMMDHFDEYANNPTIAQKLANKTANYKFIHNAVISQANELDAWDYIWIFCCFCNNGLIATPKINLVENVGFGDGATHTGNNEDMGVKSHEIELPLQHPKVITTDHGLDERFYKEVFGWMATWEKLTRPSYYRKFIKARVGI